MFKNVEFTKLQGSALETEFSYFGEQEEVSQAVLSVQANQQFIICKVMFRYSVDSQVSWPFPYVMNGMLAAATICTKAKMRKRAAMIVDVAVCM